MRDFNSLNLDSARGSIWWVRPQLSNKNKSDLGRQIQRGRALQLHPDDLAVVLGRPRHIRHVLHLRVRAGAPVRWTRVVVVPLVMVVVVVGDRVVVGVLSRVDRGGRGAIVRHDDQLLVVRVGAGHGRSVVLGAAAASGLHAQIDGVVLLGGGCGGRWRSGWRHGGRDDLFWFLFLLGAAGGFVARASLGLEHGVQVEALGEGVGGLVGFRRSGGVAVAVVTAGVVVIWCKAAVVVGKR
uniref:(northern house mosquito) hypothetical protein n=1 Tax=Culex pipiens TaxID=7175 RepID=A0A8D8FFG3_CULPI